MLKWLNNSGINSNDDDDDDDDDDNIFRVHLQIQQTDFLLMI